MVLLRAAVAGTGFRSCRQPTICSMGTTIFLTPQLKQGMKYSPSSFQSGFFKGFWQLAHLRGMGKGIKGMERDAEPLSSGLARRQRNLAKDSVAEDAKGVN